MKRVLANCSWTSIMTLLDRIHFGPALWVTNKCCQLRRRTRATRSFVLSTKVNALGDKLTSVGHRSNVDRRKHCQLGSTDDVHTVVYRTGRIQHQRAKFTTLYGDRRAVAKLPTSSVRNKVPEGGGTEVLPKIIYILRRQNITFLVLHWYCLISVL